jgi:hypothetical protein
MSRLAPVKWTTLTEIWRDRAVNLLAGKSGSHVDQGFIDRLQARRTELDRLYWRIAVVQMVLTIALFLNAIVLPAAEVSIAGLSAKQVGAIKEIVLFVAATLSVFLAIVALERQAVGVFLLTWARKHFPADMTYAVESIYDSWPHMPEIVHRQAGRYRPATRLLAATYALLAILYVAWMILMVAASVIVFVVIAVDVATTPSLPVFWSRAIVAYAAIGYAMYFIFLVLLHSPLPFRDYSLVMELDELRKQSKEKYEERLRDIVNLQRQSQ